MISIDLSEFPVEVICALLTFVYTAEMEITSETVGPILKCADELGICVIVGMCVDYLSNVNIDNAIMFYSIAENYDLCDIKECIYKFIVDNFSEVRHGHNVRNKRRVETKNRAASVLEVINDHIENKTAELSQRRPRDAPNIWVP